MPPLMGLPAAPAAEIVHQPTGISNGPVQTDVAGTAVWPVPKGTGAHVQHSYLMKRTSFWNSLSCSKCGLHFSLVDRLPNLAQEGGWSEGLLKGLRVRVEYPVVSYGIDRIPAASAATSAIGTANFKTLLTPSAASAQLGPSRWKSTSSQGRRRGQVPVADEFEV